MSTRRDGRSRAPSGASRSHPATRAHYLAAGALFHLGRRDQSLAWTRQARELDPDGSGTLYNVACALAMLGHHDEALDALEQAVSVGFGHRSWFERDPDLTSVREHPRFAALLGMRDRAGFDRGAPVRASAGSGEIQRVRERVHGHVGLAVHVACVPDAVKRGERKSCTERALSLRRIARG